MIAAAQAPTPVLIFAAVFLSYFIVSGFMYLVWPRSWVKSKWALYSPMFIRDTDRVGWVLSLRIMGFVFICFGARMFEGVLIGTRFLDPVFYVLLAGVVYTWGPLAAFTGWCYAAPRFLRPSSNWSMVPVVFQEVIERSLLARIGATVFGIFLFLVGVGATVHLWFGPFIDSQQSLGLLP